MTREQIDHGAVVDVEVLGYATVWSSPDGEWNIDIENVTQIYEDGFEETVDGDIELWRRNPDYDLEASFRFHSEAETEDEIEEAYHAGREWLRVDPVTPTVPGAVKKAFEARK